MIRLMCAGPGWVLAERLTLTRSAGAGLKQDFHIPNGRALEEVID